MAKDEKIHYTEMALEESKLVDFFTEIFQNHWRDIVFGPSIDGAVYDFSIELQGIATDKGARNISQYIRQLSKRRNQVLYATTAGIPSVLDNLDKFLRYREEVVYTNLMVFLLIDPYKTHQLLVQQCLDSFLKILPYLKKQGG